MDVRRLIFRAPMDLSVLMNCPFRYTTCLRMRSDQVPPLLLWYFGNLERTLYLSDCTAVFDIDGTLLEDGTGVPVESIVASWFLAKEFGLRCKVLTARSERGRAFTLSQLEAAGIELPSSDLIMMSSYVYNKEVGRLVASENGRYPIMMTVGDRITDIGDHCSLGILLENE